MSEDLQGFVEFIKLQTFDDQYVDRQEEKKILEEGVKRGIGVDKSLSILKEVADEKGYVVERFIEERAKGLLERFATNDGQIDKKEFDDAVALFKEDSKGRVKEDDIKKRLKQIVVDNNWKPKEGGLFGSKWFSAI